MFAYTAKAVFYGLITARLARVRRRVVMITGLGYAFTDGREFKGVSTILAMAAYRLTLPLAHRVIFQNPDDQAFFVARGLVRSERAARVNGSGVIWITMRQRRFRTVRSPSF